MSCSPHSARGLIKGLSTERQQKRVWAAFINSGIEPGPFSVPLAFLPTDNIKNRPWALWENYSVQFDDDSAERVQSLKPTRM